MFVVFDIGNVILHVDLNRFIDAFDSHMEMMGISDQDGFSFLESIQAAQDKGLTTVGRSLRDRLKLSDGDINHLVRAWNDTVSKNQKMFSLLERLKANQVRIALFSNMGPEHLSHLKQAYPEIWQDTIHHVSCEVGTRKPQKLFYQSFLWDHPEFKGALYVDDLEANLEVGVKYGFRPFKLSLDHVAHDDSIHETEINSILDQLVR